MKKKIKIFTAQFRVEVYTDVAIKAESLEDALNQAKEFDVTDVVEIPGGHVDSNIRLTGVFDTDL